MKRRSLRRSCLLILLTAGVILICGAANTGAFADSSGWCAGDCDGSAEVSIDELVRLVNIALDELPMSECTAGDVNGDGTVTIEELIAAVNSALGICVPDVSGTWIQDEVRISSSTCFSELTSGIQQLIDEGTFNCEYDLEQHGYDVTMTERCAGSTVTGTVSVDADGTLTYVDSGQETQNGCTLLLSDRFAVALASSPASGTLNNIFDFSGTCAALDCTMVVSMRGTRL